MCGVSCLRSVAGRGGRRCGEAARGVAARAVDVRCAGGDTGAARPLNSVATDAPYATEWRSGRTRTRMGHFSALDCSWVVLLGDWPDNPMREARLRTDGTWLVLRDTDFQAMARAAGDLNLNL